MAKDVVLHQRSVLEKAYSAVVGTEKASSMQATTYESLVAMQLDRLTKGGMDGISASTSVTKLEDDLKAVFTELAQGKKVNEPVNS